MKEDPIIAEVRRARHRISAQFGHDVRRLCEHYMELEKKTRASGEHRYVELPPRNLAPVLHASPPRRNKNEAIRRAPCTRGTAWPRLRPIA